MSETVRRAPTAGRAQDGALWRVADVTTGRHTRLSDYGDWAGATSMTSMSGNLYVIQGSRLWASIL